MAYSRSERRDHKHTRPKKEGLKIDKLGKIDMKEYEKYFGKGGVEDQRLYQQSLRYMLEMEKDDQADRIRYNKAKQGKKLLHKKLYRGSDIY